jgi:hypothetical protein
MNPAEIKEMYPNIDLAKDQKHFDKRIIVDASKFTDKRYGLEEIYSQLGFGRYVSVANLDGLEDLLNPKAWEDKSIVITVENSQKLENVDEGTLQIFGVFNSVIAEWRDNGKTFKVDMR